MILVVLMACGFSFAAGGLAVWLAGPEHAGPEMYRIAGRSYGRDAALAEFAVTMKMSSQFSPAQRTRFSTNTAFRNLWLRNRYLSDILAAHAGSSGWLDSAECQAWLRLAVREAVRQYVLVRHLDDVTVSSNEVIRWYDAHARSLQQLPLDEAMVYAGERALLEKRQDALMERTLEYAKKLDAIFKTTNL
ncbi:MAG TPA: hypothetical protein PLM00_07890 [Spirochaetota bacterium]|nr:hypothetical protein [Spirochaetota bacterium]